MVMAGIRRFQATLSWPVSTKATWFKHLKRIALASVKMPLCRVLLPLLLISKLPTWLLTFLHRKVCCAQWFRNKLLSDKACAKA
ncbi:UNVERIFIED_CONTAM: hypothetical protein GTU68_010585 [Idotea baltica]|nr:hypothetical protein [Idotea baltica]